ncbi:hypothetical protein [Flavobacterium sp.]|uniref:hypothetical protein n=1 Tax=Flavobacterium sp. TaxID=239 RepID=UPI00286D9073|nr:hypothetical protein [Flavobacterium sp.]
MKKLLLVALAISLFSCSSDDSAAPIVPIPTSSIAYFRALLNGVALDYSMNNNINPTHSNGFYIGFSGVNTFDRSYYYGSYLIPSTTINDFPQISLTFNNMFNTSLSTESETSAFNTNFTTPPTNFITNTENSNNIKGIDVSYQSPNGVRYSTLSGSQTGSIMAVLSSVAGIESGGFLKTQTVTGTVSCKLYNENDASDVIVLTNGTYKLVFREDN